MPGSAGVTLVTTKPTALLKYDQQTILDEKDKEQMVKVSQEFMI